MCRSISHLPKIYQSFLMSATLSEDVQALKELLLHNPVRKTQTRVVLILVFLFKTFFDGVPN